MVHVLQLEGAEGQTPALGPDGEVRGRGLVARLVGVLETGLVVGLEAGLVAVLGGRDSGGANGRASGGI